MRPRYWVRGPDDTDYREATEEDFVRAERAAGFRPRYGRPHWRPCTHGFSGHGWAGRTRYRAETDGEAA